MALSTRSPNRPGLAATRARQARLGRRLLWVLLFSLLLVILGFFMAWTWTAPSAASSAPAAAWTPADARAFDAPQDHANRRR